MLQLRLLAHLRRWHRIDPEAKHFVEFRRRLVGGADVAAKQSDRSRPVQRAAGSHFGPSRVHQEDPEDLGG